MRRARVHFYFRGQVRLLERLLQYGLVGGRPLVVVRGDGDEELRLRLRGLKMRTVRTYSLLADAVIERPPLTRLTLYTLGDSP